MMNRLRLKIALYVALLITEILGSQVYAVPSLAIPQVPLVLATPIHPQVLIAIGNSESMDGTVSGAIMAGSGSLPLSLSSLNISSSPIYYTVPTGFSPPVQAANAIGQAPYTVNQSGNWVDNSPSRLNVAKGAIKAILQNYMSSADFALEVFKTSSVGVYSTWVYYMSPTGSNFIFTNDASNAANLYVNNPCYNYTLASSTVSANCASIASLFSAGTVATSLYIQIGATSDNPQINDVLYASGGYPGVFITYQGPTPTTPFPPNYTLVNYNNGSIRIAYGKSLPSVGPFSSSPTNAGFVPYSLQVMYAQRGFGFNGSQSPSTGNVLVPMTTAGTAPTTSSVTNAINLFLPALNPETNSTSTTEIKSSAVQSPIAGLLSGASTYLSSLPITSGSCPQKKYVILISDGLPTQDLSGKFWPPLGSLSASGYGVSATFNADGSLNATNCQAVTDTINILKTLNTNGVLSYIVGLGAGVSSTINPQAAATLQAMAIAGGTQNYYPAVDPQTLVNQLTSIFLSIQSNTYSTSGAAVSATQLTSNSVQYNASFVSNDVPYHDWTGNLTATPINPTTGLPLGSTLWSAQGLLDTLTSGTGWSSNRYVATWNPTTLTGIPFAWTSLTATQQSSLQPTDTQGLNRLNYILGSTALEQRNGGTFRNRSHILGDIIDSQSLYVGAPQSPYLSTSYASFATAQANRQSFLYVGANDGMLHAFNATTGVEGFAFIPNAVFKNLINLTQTIYNQSHLFFVDSSPVSGDVQFSDGSWHTIVIGGEGAGGNSIYGLDVTNPTSLNTSTKVAQSVLFEFTDGDLGLTFSIPQIAEVNASTSSFAVFFGNGYNSPTNSAVLYAINPQNGSVISKINLCAAVPSACNTALPQGLSSVAVGQIDGLQGVPITTVYAGDLQGNLWAVDVSSTNPAQWTARLLFQARDSGGNPQPITTPPVVTLHPNYPRNQGLFVMFGTGQLLVTADLQTTQTQTVYGVWDKPAANTTFTRSNLQQQTLNLVSTATSGLSQPILTASSNAILWGSQVGWYDDLPTGGQRVITASDIVNGSFITVLNTPPLVPCSNQFSSMLLELNFKTGGAFSQPMLNIGNGGTFSQYNGLNPVGIGLGNYYSSSPVYLGINGNNNIAIATMQSNGTQNVTYNPNNTPRRVGWWQLK